MEMAIGRLHPLAVNSVGNINDGSSKARGRGDSTTHCLQHMAWWQRQKPAMLAVRLLTPRESTKSGLESEVRVCATGEEAEAKRAKREGQEDAAAAKVCQGWAVSPAGIREALCSASSSIDLSDMHDAAEVSR